jgi:tocopherol O-methyltransferase
MNSTNNDFSPKRIGKYYDVNTRYYRLLWHGRKSLGIHFGYFDKGINNKEDAIINVNRTLANIAKIKAGDKVLDAGCGVGGSAIWLAKNIGASVIGITVSQKQIKKANKYAKEEGVEKKVNFLLKDFNETGFEDKSFNVVWAIESVCYSLDKLKTLKEFYRILKPGGKLIMSDEFVYSYDLKKEERELIDGLAHGYMLDTFATPDNFKEDLIKAGFRDVQFIDRHKDMEINLKYSMKKINKLAPIAKILPKLIPYFNEVAINYHGAVAGEKAFKKGLWTLGTIYAKKIE